MASAPAADDDLDRQFEAAQRELAAIKSRYTTAPRSEVVKVPARAPAAASSATMPLAELPADPVATKRLEVAENVMLKLYKRNMQLEDQVRQLSEELAKARESSRNSEPAETASAEGESTEKDATLGTATDRGANAPSETLQPEGRRPLEPVPTALTSRTPEMNATASTQGDSAHPTVGMENNGTEDNVARMKREIEALRIDCARFAAKNRAVREDFKSLAQQKVDALTSSSAKAHASQHLLKILVHRLDTIERERDADAKAFASRIVEAENAGRDAYLAAAKRMSL